MSTDRRTAAAPRGPWLVPTAVFVLAATVVTVLWWQQAQVQRRLLQRHTEDVGVQASRRAEVYLQTQLDVAELFARRWATHETRDYSRRRFDRFAEAIVAEQPAYRGLALLDHPGGEPWIFPHRNVSLPGFLRSNGGELIDRARRTKGVLLAPPSETEAAGTLLHAALPAWRGEELVGLIVIELDVAAIFAELFHRRIRNEFGFSIEDEGRIVFRFAPDVPVAVFQDGPIRSSSEIAIAGRSWTMTVVPRPAELHTVGWRSNLSVLLFGLALALGLAGASWLLGRRAMAVRAARDEALHELAIRRKAERDRKASEARYRSVFDSASEGLIVFDLDERIVEANEAACLMHGRAPGALDGLSVRELIAEDQQHRFDDFMDSLRQQDTVVLESINQRADGQRIAVEVRGTRFAHDDEPAILVILTDVTERKAAMRQQLRLSRQVLVAQEDERSRLSRDLHDGLGQTLTAIRLELDWLSRKCRACSAQAPISFAQASRLVESSAQELRRMCRGLRPPLLDDLGLEPALRQLVDEFRDRGAGAISFTVDFDEEEQALTPEACLCAYRVLQEALTNIRRHARADHVAVTLTVSHRGLALEVADDGAGFALADPSTHTHFGIAGMRERASLVDGTFEIDTAVGAGTTLQLRIPPSHVHGEEHEPPSRPSTPTSSVRQEAS